MRKQIGGFTIIGVLVVAPLLGQQLTTPSDWRWRTDAPAKLVSGDPLPPDGWSFVAMPPGWHVRMGPGGLLYQPEYQGRGNFVLEAEIFLFPGSSTEEYGLFIGGRALEGASAGPSYVAFVARRDGHSAVVERKPEGLTPVVNWMANSAFMPQAGTDAIKNILKVDIGAVEVVFSANGKEAAKLARAKVNTDGQFGFRVGKGINLHISRLDVTHRLAPVKK